MIVSNAALRFSSVLAFLPNALSTWLSIIILPFTTAITLSAHADCAVPKVAIIAIINDLIEVNFMLVSFCNDLKYLLV